MPILQPEYEVLADSIKSLVARLDEYLEPYYRHFGRKENHEHARMYVAGRTARMNRRTLEPIATANGVPRRPLQTFVGAGLWSDDEVRSQLVEQIATEIGSPHGVLIFDASGFQKWGKKSVGVKRQWCGRLGKVENCQVGEFLGYATPHGHTLVDCRLYLPQEWAKDKTRRAAAHIPKEIKFLKGWELAYEMHQRQASALPHEWTVGDDAYGRIPELRDRLDFDGEPYLLEVPSGTIVRKNGMGPPRSIAQIADSLPGKLWTTVRLRDGEKGPIEVRAIKLRVTAGKNNTKENRRRETLLILRRPKTGERWNYLSNRKGVSVQTMAKAAACRHYIEQSLQEGKGQVGLAQYEVRSWVGWHHHMTLAMLALHFLVREKYRLKKRPRR